MPTIDKSQAITTIKPRTGWVPIDSAELWSYRELIGLFVIRDIKVKYKQTFLGIAWAVLQPFAYTIVFSLFFGKLAKIPSEGLPYPLFSFTALILWTYFQTALQFSSNCLVTNQQLVSKIYFPRLLLPTSASLAALVDLLITLVLLLIILPVYGVPITPRMLWAFPFILLAVLTALGVGMWLSAINVKFRDIQYTIPFITQLWLFISPVVYPSSIVPEGYRLLYGLNPMVAVLEGFKWAILPGMPLPSIPMMVVSIITILMLFVGGAYYFQRMEREFADVV